MSEKTSTNVELEAYKAQVKLHNVRTHYRYAIVLVSITMLIIGTIVGYFFSINIISTAQAKVVNSIELSVKDKQ